jgi:hypothetical protein
MGRTDGRGVVDGVKNRSGKWEGLTKGAGVDKVKNQSGKWEGPRGGGPTGYITHLCIMHGAHTSYL